MNSFTKIIIIIIPAERHCPEGACQNGGHCVVHDWQMMCLCSPGFSGTYCNVSGVHMTGDNARSITIFIGVLSGSILLITLLALALCR